MLAGFVVLLLIGGCFSQESASWEKMDECASLLHIDLPFQPEDVGNCNGLFIPSQSGQARWKQYEAKGCTRIKIPIGYVSPFCRVDDRPKCIVRGTSNETNIGNSWTKDKVCVRYLNGGCKYVDHPSRKIAEFPISKSFIKDYSFEAKTERDCFWNLAYYTQRAHVVGPAADELRDIIRKQYQRSNCSEKVRLRRQCEPEPTANPPRCAKVYPQAQICAAKYQVTRLRPEMRPYQVPKMICSSYLTPEYYDCVKNL